MNSNFLMTKQKARILMALAKNGRKYHCSRLSRDIDCTYAHVVNLINNMVKEKIIISKKTGRSRILELTPKGKQVAFHVTELWRLLKNETFK